MIDKWGPLSNIDPGGYNLNHRIRSVLQYDLQGNFVKEYDSVGEAVSMTKIVNISACCSGKRNLAGKFIWRYKMEDNYPQTIDTSFLGNMEHFGNYETKVIQFDMEGNIIEKFDSILEASKKTGCSSARIVDVCRNRRNHTKNFKWSYEDNYQFNRFK